MRIFYAFLVSRKVKGIGRMEGQTDTHGATLNVPPRDGCIIML